MGLGKILKSVGEAAPAFGVASAIANPILQGAQNRKNRKWAERRYNIERAHALEDWHRQNTYNSPVEWRKRMEAAGINPFYTGQSVGANAGAVSKTDTKTPQQQAAQSSFGDIFTGQQLGLETDKTRAMVQNMNSVTKLNLVKAKREGVGVLSDEQQLQFDKELHVLNVDSMKANIRATEVATWARINSDQRAWVKQMLDIKKDSRDALELTDKMLNSATNRTYTNSQLEKLQIVKGILRQDKDINQVRRNRAVQDKRLPEDPQYVKTFYSIIDMLMSGQKKPSQAAKELKKLIEAENKTGTTARSFE